jgi:hypothetical protein
MMISNYLADLAARIEAEHAAASEAARSHVDHAMRAGDLLIEAKAQLGHGAWLPWLADRGIVERTAQLYMRLARNRETIKSATVADLTLRGSVEFLALRPFVMSEAKRMHAEARALSPRHGRVLAALLTRYADGDLDPENELAEVEAASARLTEAATAAQAIIDKADALDAPSD